MLLFLDITPGNLLKEIHGNQSVLIEFSYVKNWTFFIVEHVGLPCDCLGCQVCIALAKESHLLLKQEVTLPQLPSYQILFLSTKE